MGSYTVYRMSGSMIQCDGPMVSYNDCSYYDVSDNANLKCNEG